MNQTDRWMYVIAYDTPDNARRRQMVKLLVQHGVRRQKSVFEAHLDSTALRDLWQRLVRLSDQREDQLSVYRCCSYCQEATMQSGPNSCAASPPPAWVV